jgi:DedD protein
LKASPTKASTQRDVALTSRLDTDEVSSGKKRRIVGTIVLLALALIILPQLFDGGGDYLPQVESRIPERPIITLIPEPQQTRPVMTADLPAGNEQAGNEQTGNEPTAEEPEAVARLIDLTPQRQDEETAVQPEESRPTLNAAGLPEGWVVQVGTFGDLANASKLREELQASGYKAYERRVQREGRDLSSVLVGPVLSRSEADALKARLLDAFALNGLVKQYEIEGLD